jgi:hypothetical protein
MEDEDILLFSSDDEWDIQQQPQVGDRYNYHDDGKEILKLQFVSYLY